MKPLCKKHIMNPLGFCILFVALSQKKTTKILVVFFNEIYAVSISEIISL